MLSFGALLRGDTLGALKWGRDKVQITKEFAQFVIGKI